MKAIVMVVLGMVPVLVAAQAPLPSERFVPSGNVAIPELAGPVTSFDVTAAGQVVTRDETFIRLLNDSGATLTIANSFPCAGATQSVRELAVDTGGRIVAQCGSGAALQRFTTAGALVDTLAAGGSGSGQVSSVTEIAILADGTIVVSDDGRNRVLLFNGSSGAFIREFGPVTGDESRGYLTRLRAIPDNAGGLIVLELVPGRDFAPRSWSTDGSLLGDYYIGSNAAPPQGFNSDGVCAFNPNSLDNEVASRSGRIFVFCQNSSQNHDVSLWSPALDVLESLPKLGQANSLSIGRSRLPSGFGEWRFPPRDVLIMPSGDLLVASGTGPVRVLRLQRTRRVLTPSAGGIAVPTLVRVAPRTGSTVYDITYRVDDSNSATVAAYVVAFRNASITPANFVRLNTLVEGTAANQGNAQPTNTPRLLSWDAAADLGVGSGFANVSFDVLVRETGALLDFRFVTIPANVPTSAFPAPLEISATPVFDNELVSVWQWLLASDDAEVALDAGALERVSDGAVLVAADGTISATGRTYLLARSGVRQATVAEADRARTGASPGEQRYGRTHQIGWAPVTNNEIGVDLQCHIENPSGYNCADRRAAGYLVVPL